MNSPPVALALAFGIVFGTAPPQRPLRAGVEVVLVDLLAFDDEDQPVTDLRAEELRLTVDRRARPITALQYVQWAGTAIMGAPDAGAKSLASGLALEPGNGSGRLVFLVVAHEQIRAGNERPVLQAFGDFLHLLSPRDRVAVVTLPVGSVMVDLTTDHAAVRAVLPFVVGRGSDIRSAAFGELSALHDFLTGLARLEGPKIVILVAEGLAGFAGGPNVTDVAKAASAARARFYIIQPHDFAIDASLRLGSPAARLSLQRQLDRQLAALEDLAGATGGALYRISGSPGPIFGRIALENSGQYLLAFEPTAAEGDGKSHTIRIRTVRRGVSIRARGEFTIDRHRP